MNEITIYGIRNCSTMKKAFDWLDGHGLSYRFHDYKKAGVDADTLQRWFERCEWQTLINKRGTTWRKLSVEQQAVNSPEQAIRLMCDNPSLIKRPVVETGQQFLVGFNEADLLAAFANGEPQ